MILKSTLTAFACIAILVSGKAQFNLALEEIADGYNRPCDIVNAGDERLFVVEQEGTIGILFPDGEQVADPFLNIESIVDAGGGEKGLLGLAFAPDYCTSGEFYVNYTITISNQLYTRVSRFAVNPDNENDALEDSEEVILQFEQDFSNHNGGQLEFGPDGYLYIGTGDGGSGGDPNNRAQTLTSLLGKILRIDVNADTYTIPQDNPFADDDFAEDEIWHYGLRNPWKFAFDSETGDLYIGDVGQSNREEISFQAAETGGGLNFGWRCYEGTASYNLSQCDDGTQFVGPIFDYPYGSVGGGFRCAVTGGRVYRGPSFDNIYGKYIFVDYCSGEHWLLWQEDGEWESFAGGNLQENITAFGSDVWGEIYAVGGGGEIYRLVDQDGDLEGPIVFDGNNTITSNLEGSSFNWTFNQEPISNENSSNLIISENGEYGLTVITASGCEVDAGTITITTISTIDYNKITYLNVFPNPAKESISIELELIGNINNKVFAGIYDVSGRLLYEEAIGNSAHVLNLSDISSGFYVLNLRLDNGVSIASRPIVVK